MACSHLSMLSFCDDGSKFNFNYISSILNGCKKEKKHWLCSHHPLFRRNVFNDPLFRIDKTADYQLFLLEFDNSVWSIELLANRIYTRFILLLIRVVLYSLWCVLVELFGIRHFFTKFIVRFKQKKKNVQAVVMQAVSFLMPLWNIITFSSSFVLF